ncbi:MAG: AEC family transporter [Alphaproteobacteria bacterium]|nr:AEC family transporter [Alphaproteobacteria bacterium]
MQAIVEVVLPVFGLIVCGYALARSPVLSVEGAKGLTGFVFYVAIPALLFRIVAKGIATDELDFTIVYAYFTGVGVVFVFAMVLGRFVFRRSFAEQALMGMTAVFGNTVMLGLPLIYMAFGDAGIVPVTLIIAFHSTILITATTLLLELSRGQRRGFALIIWAALKALIKNPVILALLAGLAWAMTGQTLPAVLDRFINLLSGAAAPCALAALGASLATYRLGGDLRECATVVGLKLLGLPVVVWFLCAWVFALDPLWTAVATIIAAQPVGANVFILAQQYDTYTARSASAVLISTILSVLVLAVMLAKLAP